MDRSDRHTAAAAAAAAATAAAAAAEADGQLIWLDVGHLCAVDVVNVWRCRCRCGTWSVNAEDAPAHSRHRSVGSIRPISHWNEQHLDGMVKNNSAFHELSQSCANASPKHVVPVTL